MYTQEIPQQEFEEARRSAVRIAAAQARRWSGLMDGEVLANTAELAVWQAAARYQPRPGSSFVLYALWFARNQVAEELRRQSPWKRLQRRQRRQLVAAGREPQPWMLPPLSLNQPAEVDGEGCTLQDDLLGADERAEVEHRLLLAQYLALLDPRRREVLERIYLRGDATQEIATDLGISVSRVQQLHRHALVTLRTAAGVDPKPLPRVRSCQGSPRVSEGGDR